VAPTARRRGTHTPYPGVTGLLLRGGQSRRLGQDKSLVRWRWDPLQERQRRLLRSVAGTVWESVGWGASPAPHLLVDEEANAGPLAPIRQALSRMEGPWLLVLAVDLPEVSPVLLARLWRRRLPGGVTLPAAGGRWQPLCALWHRETLPYVEAAWLKGERRVLAPLEQGCPVRVVELRRGEQVWLTNINTAADILGATAPRWIQVAGYSGSGKTRMLARLVARLAAAGETAEVWKISHHPVAPRQPGRDSFSLLQAGARAAWVWGDGGLLAHGHLDPERLASGTATSWLVVEGGRRWPTPKILLVAETWPEHEGPVLATAGKGGPQRELNSLHCDAALPDEAERVADWLFEHRFWVSVPVREVALWPSAN